MKRRRRREREEDKKEEEKKKMKEEKFGEGESKEVGSNSREGLRTRK